MKSVNSKSIFLGARILQGKVESSERCTSTLLCWPGLLALAWILGYGAWLIFGTSLSATQAQLHTDAIGALGLQLARAQPIPDWNIPYQSIAVWLVWLTGIVSLGLLTTHSVRFPDSVKMAGRLAIWFAVGFTAFGTVQLLAGLAGFIKLPLILLPGALITAACLPASRRNFQLVACATWWRWNGLTVPAKLIAFTAIILYLLPQLAALVPPIQSDGVRYHLAAPQEFLKLGKITYLPLNAYSNMPFLVEMHYLAALACGAPEASQLMHSTLAAFTAIALYALIRSLTVNYGSVTAAQGALIAFSYLAIPTSTVLAAWPFTDHGISFFLVVSILLGLGAPKHTRLGFWIIFGLVIGGLNGTKYTMAPMALLIWVMSLIITGSRFRSVILQAFAAATVAGIFGGIWYLKNVTLTGNPFYPLTSSIFPGGDWTAASSQFLRDRAGEKGMGMSFRSLIFVPWNLTTQWIRFEAHNPGPIPLLVLVLSLVGGLTGMFRRNLPMGALWVLGLALCCFLIWFYSYQSNRLLLPAMALFLAALPAMPCINRCMRFVCSTIALGSLYGLLWASQWSLVTTALSPAPLVYLTGQINSNLFRHQSLSYARGFDYLNTHVQPDEKVLIIGDYRIYGARFQGIWSDWFDQPALANIIESHGLADTSQLLSWLRGNHVKWIMINNREIALQSGGPVDLYRSRFTDSEWQIHSDIIGLKEPEVSVLNFAPGVKLIHLDKTP